MTLCFYAQCINCNQMKPDVLQNGRNLMGWCGDCRQQQKIINRRKQSAKSNLKLKIEIVNHYGGRCVYCGETDISKLSVDHVNGDGGKRRKEGIYGALGAGFQLYYWLRRNKYPDGYQICCRECNWIKGNMNHEKFVRKITTIHEHLQEKEKLAA